MWLPASWAENNKMSEIIFSISDSFYLFITNRKMSVGSHVGQASNYYNHTSFHDVVVLYGGQQWRRYPRHALKWQTTTKESPTYSFEWRAMEPPKSEKERRTRVKISSPVSFLFSAVVEWSQREMTEIQIENRLTGLKVHSARIRVFRLLCAGVYKSHSISLLFAFNLLRLFASLLDTRMHGHLRRAPLYWH